MSAILSGEKLENFCKELNIDSSNVSRILIRINNRVVRKLKMWYNLSARYERRKLESSLYGVTLIHI